LEVRSRFFGIRGQKRKYRRSIYLWAALAPAMKERVKLEGAKLLQFSVMAESQRGA